MMPEIRCPVCSRLQMKGQLAVGTVIEVKCRCKSLLLLTATGVSADVPQRFLRSVWQHNQSHVEIGVLT